jgi:hypothetical protein
LALALVLSLVERERQQRVVGYGHPPAFRP